MGGPAGAPLRCLRRLQRGRCGLLAPHAPVLALLAARCSGAGELGAALALLAREAARPGGGFAGARAGVEPPNRGSRLGGLCLSAQDGAIAAPCDGRANLGTAVLLRMKSMERDGIYIQVEAKLPCQGAMPSRKRALTSCIPQLGRVACWLLAHRLAASLGAASCLLPSLARC